MKRKKAVKTLMGYGKSRNEANDLLTYSSASLSNEEICQTVFVEMLIESFPDIAENICQRIAEMVKTLVEETAVAAQKIAEVVSNLPAMAQEAAMMVEQNKGNPDI